MATDEQAQPTVKVMKLRYAGVCTCGVELAAGIRAGWDKTARRVLCETCVAALTAAASAGSAPLTVPEEELVDVGRPGSSLEQTYQRRKQARQNRVRARLPRLGGLLLALFDDPASTKAFATGAMGERRIAARLEKDCGEEVLFLHNRKLGIGRRDGDIDHVAIAPSGIYVIDAKSYKDATVRVRRTGGFLSPVKEQLMVGGRDRTKMVDGCAKQVAAVVAALAGHSLTEGLSVAALLCFDNADLPMWGELELRGVRVLGPRGTGKLLRRRGPLTEPDRRSLHRYLATALPPA
jgi:hypothetical protein